MNLHGKVVLITGGRRVGSALAGLLADRGASIAMTYRSSREAIGRTEGRRYRGGRFRVYDREGEACVNRGCNGVIRRITQAGRSTFYCPVCQK